MSQYIHLTAGILKIDLHKSDLSLDYLLGFASRINPKRGYLFVSKVLGKHIPCKPSIMRGIYNRLAALLPKVSDPVIFIGMAETATGLGAGVADSFVKLTAYGDVVFQHTTRHKLSAAEWVCFDEIHSHAPSHILYQPLPALWQQFLKAKTLVLVDDEISTGRTLTQLGRELIGKLPNIGSVILLSIVNWLSATQKQAIQESFARAVSFINLLEGTFSFIPNVGFKPVLPKKVKRLQPTLQARQDIGRRGMNMREALIIKGPYPKRHNVSVVGTGEFLFQPFLWAESLEKKVLMCYFRALPDRRFRLVTLLVRAYALKMNTRRVLIIICIIHLVVEKLSLLMSLLS